MDADPSRELRPFWMLVKFEYRLQDCEARSQGTLGVVIVRLRITEIGHHSVAQVLRHVSTEALDRLSGGVVVTGDGIAPFFGIEMASYLRRTNEIAEQHRQMPALSIGPVVC